MTARVCSRVPWQWCLTFNGRGRVQGTFGLWRSLVARLVRDEEAAGSNPVSPTDPQGPEMAYELRKQARGSTDPRACSVAETLNPRHQTSTNQRVQT